MINRVVINGQLFENLPLEQNGKLPKQYLITRNIKKAKFEREINLFSLKIDF